MYSFIALKEEGDTHTHTHTHVVWLQQQQWITSQPFGKLKLNAGLWSNVESHPEKCSVCGKWGGIVGEDCCTLEKTILTKMRNKRHARTNARHTYHISINKH